MSNNVAKIEFDDQLPKFCENFFLGSTLFFNYLVSFRDHFAAYMFNYFFDRKLPGI
jgi:hypothetical protein